MKEVPLKIGKEYGRLTVLGKKKEPGNSYWECRCICGKIVKASSYNIRSGIVVSCGCRKLDHLREMNTTHGLSKLPEYKVWENMISRCKIKNTPYYKHYGGRGITICKRWYDSFESFLNDMGRRPSSLHELDRYPNNDGDYEPSNCRWATRSEQLNNIRNNFRITLNGVTRTATEWSRISGIHSATIKSRIEMGRTPKQAIFGKKWSQQRGEW